MKRIVVNGGKPLSGRVSISGSKNAALPIIFACILINGVSEIENLPDIGDVSTALNLLRGFGASVSKMGNITTIDTRSLSYSEPNPRLVESIRASTYLIGSCLARFGRCPIMSFGGCNFSLRPIDMHIDACTLIGAGLDDDMLRCNKLRGGLIEFKKASVGATVNAILLAATAEGNTIIRGCAVEPHIDSLIEFLNCAGGSIIRAGRDIYVGGRELHGGKISVIGDMIEAGSYLALGVMSGGVVDILNSPVDNMYEIVNALKNLGADIHLENNLIGVKACESRYHSVIASPYPGFPTDLQPIIAPLMANGAGGKITDTVWSTRFGYLSSLAEFGIKYRLKGNSAEIYKSAIHSGIAVAPDLRGGMACLMTALAVEGQSIIYSAETILRGYENLVEKLSVLSAEINIEDI